MKKVKLSLALILPLLSSFVFAEDDYSLLMKSINDDLKTYEKVATSTKKNEHYQPYIISVLESETLKKIGVQTLKDALELIAGVDISNDNLNYKSPIFRGSNPTSFGQSKLIIDGILVNNVYTDGYSEYLSMPIELIKRIEVIRGPGNESDQTISYAGSIRVVTYSEDVDKEGGLAFTKIGSLGLKTGGFNKGYKSGDFSLFTDFYYKEHDESAFAKSDILKSGIYDFQTPFYTIDNSRLSRSGDVPLWIKNLSLGVILNYKEFSLTNRIYTQEGGLAFGYDYMIPEDDDSLKFLNKYTELAYKKELENLKIVATIGMKYDGIKAHQCSVYKGIELPIDLKQSIVYENGILVELKSKQKHYYHRSNITYSGIDKHKINFGYNLSKTETVKVVSKRTNAITGKGMTDYSDISPFLKKGSSRESYIVTVQDKYDYSDKLIFQYGLDYEDNTQIAAQLNPKLSLVYHKDKKNIFKFLYAKSHRTPSWQEVFLINNHSRVGNKNLKAEKIDTFEASHIKYFSQDSFIQSTLFYLINKNQIHNMTKNKQFINNDKDNQLYGLELEYKGKLLPNDSIYLNLSYVNGSNSYDDSLSQVSNILLKGYYIYNLKENLSLSTLVKYNSSKDRLKLDKRDKIDALTTVDTSLSYKNYKNDYRVSLGVKNIFDTDIIYPSAPHTYEDDYPSAGRSFTLSFEKKF